MSVGPLLANLKELFLDPRSFLLNKLMKSVSSGLGRRTDNDPSVSFDTDGDRSSPVSRSDDVIAKVFVGIRGRCDRMLVIHSLITFGSSFRQTPEPTTPSWLKTAGRMQTAPRLGA